MAELVQLPLAFAPAIVRAHGLRDAHTRPLVARHKGEAFRVPPERAWQYPLIELRAANTWPILGFDCDAPEKLVEALWGLGSAPALPSPNWIVRRNRNGHCHVTYCLDRPVHRGPKARNKPLMLFGRVAEFYRDAMGADAGYAGVLTHNPVPCLHRRPGEFETLWKRKAPYRLRELAEPIPKGWKIPREPTTEAGRNCAIFATLMSFAGSPLNLYRELGPIAQIINALLLDPLPVSEVYGIAKSVERYRRQWIAQGRFYTEAEREAWGRNMGRRSGEARREQTEDRDRRIVELRGEGLTQREIAETVGVSQGRVSQVLANYTDSVPLGSGG